MGAQGKPPATTASQRVKVYHLNEEGKWDDRGTGQVSVGYLERSEDLALFVIDEDDSETLLAHRIGSDENYQRQEDTIISWRDPEYSTELALSFQEIAGCSFVWEHIRNAGKNLHFSNISDQESPQSVTEPLETSGMSQANEEAFNCLSTELRELPAVELSTLPAIIKIVAESGITDQIRVAELIIHDQDFFPKLLNLFRMCEDLEDMDALRKIFRLVKGIILLNSPQIFDKIFSDKFIMDIIGTLEYDQEIFRVHHRAFLKEHVVFKEAIPIKDPSVLSKIHQTYRIGYIKDVILPRILDESTTVNLNSIIQGNNVAVISLLKDDSTFIKELFARMKSSTASTETKKNLVVFLHEFCSLSKSLPVVNQLRLFRDLMYEGIFDIIAVALQSEDKRLVLIGTDILLLFLNQDANLLRSYIIRPEGRPLLGLLHPSSSFSRVSSVMCMPAFLVKGMLTDFGEEMHCQFLEILRNLLDWFSAGSQRETIIEIFYEKHLDQLIEVIMLSCPPKGLTTSTTEKSAAGDGHGSQVVIKPEILTNICELLCFCILHHPYRIKCNFLLNNMIGKVLLLVHRREKYLVVAAVRFMRIIICRNASDEQLLSHIVKKNHLKPIVDAFIANGDRYNLLNSAVLDLFEYIRKENIKTLIMYIVDSFWSQLVKFEPFATVSQLKLKYEQNKEKIDPEKCINENPRKRYDERALDKEEEDYFNEDSDEEDTASDSSLDVQQENQTSLPATSCHASLRNKVETLGGDERSTSPLTLKRKSNYDEEVLEPTKKQKLDDDLSNRDNVLNTAPQSVCNPEAESSKPLIRTSGEKFSEEEAQSKEQRSSDNSPSTSEICQVTDGGSAVAPINGSDSTSKLIVDEGSTTGSCVR
ncbi:serine/threonine-protein phosphatase 4 regulatory subunit 3-like isoform X2 [Papaver somniferum]|uniref:serine/threonine-protein phosphatase 4 regulatory subunit 3-like isoform X2 n=1 Tax=Papaver somniferum TaxID=3469 RepID=UPI000E6FE1FB|nr:serine/threonine-protein phosphatase 4 regulatory subunit 3-like isoform X2 [Papaver somniferum]